MHEVRPLVGDDAGEFWRFRLSALEQSPQAFGESAAEVRATQVDVLAGRLRASSVDNFVLGAFVGGRLVGTAGFIRETASKRTHKGRLWGVYVDPAFRRRGIAREMMTALLTRIRQVDGLRQVTLAVATTQAGAIALYESLGFVTFGLERGSLHVGDAYIDEEHRVLGLN